MALTPQMRQSIKLLGMSTKDLAEYIDSVAAANPFLQKLFTTPSSKPSSYSGGAIGISGEARQEKMAAAKEAPREVLISQLRMADITGKMLEIAEYLIYEMDDNGYITVDCEETAQELSCDIEEVEEAIGAIQGLEPAGIGARDVRECLQLQLKRAGGENSLEYTIVTGFITELASNDANMIAKALNIDAPSVQKAINSVKKLNPRPASTLLSSMQQMIIPDLVVKLRGRKIYLELNSEWLPRLKLYNPYEDKLEIIKDPEAKEFLKENMRAAKTLLDSLKRREETMCKVADYIIKFQKEALMDDKNEIKTLTIKNVSEALKLHPSTISRTVSNKYIQIDANVIPLSSLLSHGMKKENGEVTSKTNIKNRIREAVNNENKARPLTDNAIQEILKKKGILIKRRTVAKYREMLRILPVHLRRKAAPDYVKSA